jgi:4-amino-4-deoxy-L-arabinose transferase-like glycosyltransferase
MMETNSSRQAAQQPGRGRLARLDFAAPWGDVAGLLLGALLFRALALALIPFDGLYGQDAFAYYDYAASLAAALARGQLPPAFFWPLGYPLHVATFAALLGHTPWAAQLVSIVAGALVAPLTYVLAREAWPEAGEARAAGVVAGLIATLGGQALISSVSTMADSAGLAWATGSAWLVLRYARNGRGATLAAASAALGVAVITRWGFALLALPWALAALAAWRAQRTPPAQALAHGALACAAGGLLVGAQLALGHTGDLQVYSWNPLNALLRDVVNPDGVFHYALPTGVFYLEPLVHPSYVFPLFAPLLAAGLWALRRAARPAQIVLLGWPLVTYAFLAGVTWQNPRFMLACLPALALWAGLGAAVLWARRPVAAVPPAAWRAGLVALVVLGLLATSLWALRALNNFVAEKKDAALAHVDYVTAHVPPGARVLTFGLTATLAHYSRFEVIELFDETPVTLQARACAQGELYLYLDLAGAADQWRGQAPDVNERWLRDHAGLEALGTFEGYTLFRVGHGGCKPPAGAFGRALPYGDALVLYWLSHTGDCLWLKMRSPRS